MGQSSDEADSAPEAAGAPRVLSDIESLDYDIDASSIFEQDLQQQSEAERSTLNKQRWLVCAAIGCGTGAVAFLIDVLTMFVLQQKYHISALAWRSLVGDDPHGAGFFAVFGVYASLSALCVAVSAGLVVFIEPVAGGSGIPEVKTYLQGVKVPRLLRTTTLLCKTIGVLFSVGGGLVVGKEGPMIHTGAIVAAGLSQGSSKTCSWRTMWLKRFRNDHDKRDFVSAGAAAGVAAAFGAPIGGVLFAMEEAATFWSQGLTWRTFFCACCSTLTLNVLLSSHHAFQTEKDSAPFGHISHPGLIAFGSFPQNDAYSLYELPVFILIGIAGGLLGALFNRANVRLTLWRKAHVVSRPRRFVEAVAVALLTARRPALLVCALPFVMRAMVPCTRIQNSIVPTKPPEPWPFTNASALDGGAGGLLPAARDGGAAARPAEWLGRHVANTTLGAADNELQRVMHALVCRCSDMQSEAVTLLLASHDSAIKTLFHARGRMGAEGEGAHELAAPITAFLLFFLFSFCMGLLTYGIAVPSGLFVPAIMCGAALGRLVGEVVEAAAPGLILSSAPGNYALIGAAAMLGGICRMTISITVIVIESTTNVSFTLPISLTIFMAKFVGDLFSEGIYDLHVHLKRFPFLPEQPPRAREWMQARHIMAQGVKTVCELEQVGTLVKLLRGTRHHGFPVVARGGGGGAGEQRVLGVILRDQLCTVLKHRQFESAGATRRSPHLNMRERAGPAGSAPPLTADAFMRPWFKDLDVDDLGLQPEDFSLHVNLRPYINEAALVTLQNTSLRRVSRLFRSMGLRHLLVVESCPKVVGMITRKDIIQGGGGDDEFPPALQPHDRPFREKWRLRWRRALQALSPGALHRGGAAAHTSRASSPRSGAHSPLDLAPLQAGPPGSFRQSSPAGSSRPSCRDAPAAAPAVSFAADANVRGPSARVAPRDPLATPLCASAVAAPIERSRPSSDMEACSLDSPAMEEAVPVRLVR